jgi:gas vesicle structural protein
MTVTSQLRNRYLDRPAPSILADVIDTILDKGLVIDIYVRVSLVGIELLPIYARIVIASVDTYLRFAEAVNRLDLTETERDLMKELT